MRDSNDERNMSASPRKGKNDQWFALNTHIGRTTDIKTKPMKALFMGLVLKV